MARGIQNGVWRSRGKLPSEWTRQVIIPLHKGHGRPANVARNYGNLGISVTHHVEAVLHRLLINRIAHYAEERGFLTDTQFGFSKAHNTEQAVAVLHWLLEAGKSVRRRRTWAAFLDCKSAFDSVRHEGLCVRLSKLSIRGRALSYLRASPLMSSRRSVRCGHAPVDESSAWRDTRSVAQGIIGAPLAFAVMVADLINALRRTRCGIRVGAGASVCSISYADVSLRCVALLMASSRRKLQTLLDAAHQNSRRNRYDFEPSKCEVVVFGGRDDAPPSAARSALSLGGVPLKASSEFRYLSVRIARQVVVVQPEAVDVQVPSQEDVLAPLALYVPAAQIALFAPPGRARTAPRARRPRPRLRLRESRMSRRAPRRSRLSDRVPRLTCKCHHKRLLARCRGGTGNTVASGRRAPLSVTRGTRRSRNTVAPPRRRGCQ